MSKGTQAKTLKKIYEYGNFRDFLNEYYNLQKEMDHRYSFRAFSKLAGFKSKSFLKLVIQGKRNLTTESIDKIAIALKLNKDETYFFRNLVHLNQSTTVDDRQNYAGQLIKSREYRKSHPLSESQYNYMSRWHFIAIRELVGLPEFQEDPEWIAERLDPQVTVAEAQEALEELLKLKLIKRDETGKLILNNKDLATPDEVVSAYAAQYHREMLKKASESIDRFTREMREISSITFPMSVQNVKNIKEIIYKCRKEIVDLISRDEKSDSVYQLNFQLFPLAPGFEHEEKKK